MDLVNYPFDTQKCSLEVESFAHTVDEIKYFWKEANGSVILSDRITNPTFNILGHKLGETFVTLTTGLVYFRSSILILDPALHRQIQPT